MNFLSVVMNVADLNRSIDFYREVLGFRVLSQEEQLAAVSAPGTDHSQVIVLRAFGSSPIGGARHIGLRAFILEADSPDHLEQIASELRLPEPPRQSTRSQLIGLLWSVAIRTG